MEQESERMTDDMGYADCDEGRICARTRRPTINIGNVTDAVTRRKSE